MNMQNTLSRHRSSWQPTRFAFTSVLTPATNNTVWTNTVWTNG